MSPGRISAGPAEREQIGRIERIDEIVVRVPFVAPFSISSATWNSKEAVLLRVEGEGDVGWGECVADPDPYYAPCC